MRWFIPLVLIALLVLSVPAVPTAQAQGERCFPETGFCISGPIRVYWEANGGLPVFGFPINAQAVETVEGRTLQVQWFERDRLEIQADGVVTAGRLGVERLEQLGTPWQFGSVTALAPGCIGQPEATGHQACGAFAQYWQQSGGLARFGLPVTGEFQTTIEGQALTVQYFERRRFELHGDMVLLGLLGREVLSNRGEMPQPQLPEPEPQPPEPAPLPPPSFNNCQADPNAALAPNFPVKIVGIDKRAEIVTLQNVSGDAVDLTGWTMCSIRGAQRHPIGGVLAPGAEQGFSGPSGPIWSNSDDDLWEPAASRRP